MYPQEEPMETVADQFAATLRRNRLLFKSWHRGTQESDLILGRFADAHLADLDSAQLERFAFGTC